MFSDNVCTVPTVVTVSSESARERKGSTRDKSKAGHDDGTGYVSLPSLITRLVRSMLCFLC